MGGTDRFEDDPALSLKLWDEFMITSEYQCSRIPQSVPQVAILLQLETPHKVLYGWHADLLHLEGIGTGARLRIQHGQPTSPKMF